jgi:hypothetical protein
MKKKQILFLIFCQAIACNNSDNDEIDAGSGEEIDAGSGEEIDAGSGEEIDTDSGEEIDTDSGEEIDTDSGEEIDAGSGEEIDAGSGEEIDTDSGEEIDTDSGEEIDTDSGEEIDEEPIQVPACLDSYFHSASIEFSNNKSWGCPEGYRCNAWAYLYRCSSGKDRYAPLFIDDDGVIHGLCSSGVCDEDEYGNQDCELYAGFYGNTCLPEKIWEKIYH